MPDSAAVQLRPRDLTNHIPISRTELDLGITLDNGQVFHWTLDPGSGIWTGLIDKTACRILQAEGGLWTDADCEVVSGYLALDDPLREIEKSFPRNPYCRSALTACRGMRILRQPFWECLASFLCSSMKQVAHIRQIITLLRERYGAAVRGSSLRAFPTAEVLAGLSEKDLRDCRLGYRAKALRDTACRIAEGNCREEELRALPTPEARRLLTGLPGVGPKIANCVLLFSLHRLEAVPVDVWIHRILVGLAGRKLTVQEAALRAETLGPYAGYVQQYLFHHARVGGILPGSATK
jgi:N-glycosylase/DNA lyase